MTMRAVLPALTAQAGVTLAVGCIAATSLLLMKVGDAGGWLPHGARPAGWSVVAWAALFLAGWALMTGAMMLPSSTSFLQAVQRVGGSVASSVAGVAFTSAWIVVGALQWTVLWIAGDILVRLGPQAAERLAGTSLVVAAVFHVSPLARTCRRACARPFAIIARHWRGSTSRLHDAARAGLHYGMTCIGCCVPMIAIMLVVGMHHLAWLLALAVAMLAMKHLVWGARLATPLAVALAAAGLAIGSGWWSVPLRSLRELCGA